MSRTSFTNKLTMLDGSVCLIKQKVALSEEGCLLGKVIWGSQKLNIQSVTHELGAITSASFEQSQVLPYIGE